MMCYKSLLAAILVSLTGQTHAQQISTSEAYTSTKNQLTQWLHVQKSLGQNNDLVSSLTLKDKTNLLVAGEIHYQPSGQPCIAYAPHRFYDKHTYDIAITLLGDCQVFLANTVHRNTNAQDGQKSDLGKHRYSVTNAFIESYASTVDKVMIYQIHGFDAKKRRTKQGRSSDVIISQGSRPATAKLQYISQCLKEKLQLTSRVYPLEVTELGGTKNILNQIAPKNSEFFHIELSSTVRTQLMQQPNLMSQFKTCITL
ncbi:MULTISPECIES: hypothetical protein [Pseudoalteromonas]|uniref:Uncharacterized protein n=1 Tax=Pseudoalteromonas haloplanktis TaxID=228 RepID=A0ABU1BBN3_PSEHA|nr:MULTISPECIES: hypothetical protein [Pseudoalteromonas]MDQ9091186.1 hypothetical protein [Pseudoalteromonas haloplanktis]TMN71382.1 hypothetical protein CWB85_11290 [Pseudoalteromonas sp. S1727]BDF93593.1 hypothetical protein KAN5_04310 [Pseudoalteromonas sp. KAN5]